MESELILTSGMVAALVIEAVKWAFIYFRKDPDFSFPAKVYAVAIPVLSFLLEPALAWLGVGGYAIPSDVQAWGKQLVVVLLASLVSVATYQYGIKHLSDYGKERIREGSAEG